MEFQLEGGRSAAIRIESGTETLLRARRTDAHRILADALTGMALAAAAAALPLSGGARAAGPQSDDSPPKRPPELPPIDIPAIAERIVRTLQPQPDERRHRL